MIDIVFPLIFSIIVFSLGCFFVYLILKDQQKWNEFWESQNRNRLLTPKNWAGSDVSKFFSYLFPIVLLVGGFLAIVASLSNLFKYLK